jgi:hypothetical protein
MPIHRACVRHRFPHRSALPIATGLDSGVGGASNPTIVRSGCSSTRTMPACSAHRRSAISSVVRSNLPAQPIDVQLRAVNLAGQACLPRVFVVQHRHGSHMACQHSGDDSHRQQRYSARARLTTRARRLRYRRSRTRRGRVSSPLLGSRFSWLFAWSSSFPTPRGGRRVVSRSVRGGCLESPLRSAPTASGSKSPVRVGRLAVRARPPRLARASADLGSERRA